MRGNMTNYHAGDYFFETRNLAHTAEKTDVPLCLSGRFDTLPVSINHNLARLEVCPPCRSQRSPPGKLTGADARLFAAKCRASAHDGLS